MACGSTINANWLYKEPICDHTHTHTHTTILWSFNSMVVLANAVMAISVRQWQFITHFNLYLYIYPHIPILYYVYIYIDTHRHFYFFIYLVIYIFEWSKQHLGVVSPLDLLIQNIYHSCRLGDSVWQEGTCSVAAMFRSRGTEQVQNFEPAFQSSGSWANEIPCGSFQTVQWVTDEVRSWSTGFA